MVGNRFHGCYPNTNMGQNHAGCIVYGRLAGTNAAMTWKIQPRPRTQLQRAEVKHGHAQEQQVRLPKPRSSGETHDGRAAAPFPNGWDKGPPGRFESRDCQGVALPELDAELDKTVTFSSAATPLTPQSVEKVAFPSTPPARRRPSAGAVRRRSARSHLRTSDPTPLNHPQVLKR